MVGSHRANDDGKLVPWSLGYNEVMEILTLLSPVLPVAESEHGTWAGPASVPSPGTCNAEALLI